MNVVYAMKHYLMMNLKHQQKNLSKYLEAVGGQNTDLYLIQW